MPKDRASPKKSSPRGKKDSPNKGNGYNTSRPRRQCATRVIYVEPAAYEDTPAPPDSEGHSESVQMAIWNAKELAVIAARSVWGPDLDVKIPRRRSLKAHATRGSLVPQEVRDSMIEIWSGHDDDWREERSDIGDTNADDVERTTFSERTVVIWLAAAGKQADVKAFCVVEPETEELGRNKREDVVWVLHLTPHDEYDKYNLHVPLLDAVTKYCQQAGIAKNVVSAPSRDGGGRCTEVWINLLEQQGFHLSEDTLEESSLQRYERIVRIPT